MLWPLLLLASGAWSSARGEWTCLMGGAVCCGRFCRWPRGPGPAYLGWGSQDEAHPQDEDKVQSWSEHLTF